MRLGTLGLHVLSVSIVVPAGAVADDSESCRSQDECESGGHRGDERH